LFWKVMVFKRFVVVACLLAACAGVAQAASPPASLHGFTCSPNLQPLLRGLSVTGVMRPVSGTEKFRMRFELLRAAHRSGPYKIVHGANLGTWIAPSDPNLGRQPGDVWNVTHPVVGVARPGYYRMRVSFAWLGSHNRRLALVTRATPACALLERRPDLLVSRLVSVTPLANPGRAAYVAAIRNRGVTAAGPFAVALSVAGGTQRAPRTPGGPGLHGRRGGDHHGRSGGRGAGLRPRQQLAHRRLSHGRLSRRASLYSVKQ
jgi:hypothetical protein